MKRYGSIIIFLVLLVVLNSVFSLWRVRLDFTSEKRFTVTEATRDVLAGLSRPVTADVYWSRQVTGLPPALQYYGDYVADLLKEYARRSDGKLNVCFHDPVAGSAAEEEAMRSGMRFEELRHGEMGSRFCLGVCFRQLGRADVSLPQLNPQAVNSLEYDLTHALMRLTDGQGLAVGIISRLPLFGGIDMEQKRQLPEWTILKMMRDSGCTVMEVPGEEPPEDGSKGRFLLPEGLDVVMLVHPGELSEATLRALDAHVQRGGRLLAFLDAGCWTDMMYEGGPKGYGKVASSSLDKLLAAWGVAFDRAHIVLDPSLATIVVNRKSVPENHYEWLTLRKPQLAAGDAVTAYLSQVELYHAGSFRWEAKDGVTVTPLLQSTEAAQAVEAAQAFRHQRVLEREYVRGGQALCLGVRVAGKLPSAYAAEKRSEATQVLVFGDADCLHDSFVTGRQTDNLQLLLNSLDSLRAEGQGLLQLRNRSFVNRRLTVLEEQGEADRRRYQEQLDKAQVERDKLEADVRALEATKKNGMLSDAEGEKLREMHDRVMTADRQLRGLQLAAGVAQERARQRIILWNLLLGPGLLLLLLLAVPYWRQWRRNWRWTLGGTVAACIIVALLMWAGNIKRSLDGYHERIAQHQNDYPVLSGSISRDKLAKVVFGGTAGGFTLVRSGERWTVQEKDGFPAEARLLNQLIESLTVARGRQLKLTSEEQAAVHLQDGMVTFEDAEGKQVCCVWFGDWRRDYRNEQQGRYVQASMPPVEAELPMVTHYLFPEVGSPAKNWLAKTLPGWGAEAKRLGRESEFRELSWCLEKRPNGYEVQGKAPRGLSVNAAVVKNIVDNFCYIKVLDVRKDVAAFKQEARLQVVGGNDFLYDYVMGPAEEGRYFVRLVNVRSAREGEKARQLLAQYGPFYMEVNGKLARAFLRNRNELFGK